jgi:hypothetical protein
MYKKGGSMSRKIDHEIWPCPLLCDYFGAHENVPEIQYGQRNVTSLFLRRFPKGVYSLKELNGIEGSRRLWTHLVVISELLLTIWDFPLRM